MPQHYNNNNHQLLLTYLGLVLRLASVQDVLHDVVAVLVLYESLDVSVQLLQDWRGLVARAVLQDPLDDPAAVGVGGQVVHLASEGVNDELESAGLYSLDTLLDHVVTILVFDTLQHVPVKFLRGVRIVMEEVGVTGICYLNDELLLVQRDRLQSFLNNSTAVHLQGQGLDMRPQLQTLLVRQSSLSQICVSQLTLFTSWVFCSGDPNSKNFCMT